LVLIKCNLSEAYQSFVQRYYDAAW